MAVDGAVTHYQKTNTRESVLHRKSGFPNNLSGYVDGSTPWKNQVHHVLVCCLFRQAKIEEALGNDTNRAEYVNDCLWVTKWDINRKDNLLLMPLWSTYLNKYKNSTSVPAGGPQNLPAHTRDHPKYTKEVKMWLTDNVWNALNVQKEPHKVDLDTILTQLENGEKKWVAALIKRGSNRQGGTWQAWVNRKQNSLWYQPFSMTKTAWCKPRLAP